MQRQANPQAEVRSQATVKAGVGARALATPPELAMIVPTLNERDNIEPLLARLGEALAGIAWEVVFVDDDSQDGPASSPA